MSFDWILTVPGGVFLVLWALIWEPKPKTKEDEEEDLLLLEDVDQDDPANDIQIDDEKPLTPKQLRGLLIRSLLRIGIGLLGVVGVVVGVFDGLQLPELLDVFAVLFGLYGVLILVVQRAEKDRRLLTLFIMGIVGLVVWNMAEYRGYQHENTWALWGALLVNGVFWYFVGRHYPTRSDTIQVEGM